MWKKLIRFSFRAKINNIDLEKNEKQKRSVDQRSKRIQHMNVFMNNDVFHAEKFFFYCALNCKDFQIIFELHFIHKKMKSTRTRMHRQYRGRSEQRIDHLSANASIYLMWHTKPDASISIEWNEQPKSLILDYYARWGTTILPLKKMPKANKSMIMLHLNPALSIIRPIANSLQLNWNSRHKLIRFLKISTYSAPLTIKASESLCTSTAGAHEQRTNHQS